MKNRSFDIVVIGGSAGCMTVITEILGHLTSEFIIPIVLVVHRLKNVRSQMPRILRGGNHKNTILEPNDKDAVEPNRVYLAPQNYHLLFEEDRTFSLDYSEPVNFSRPSIDVSFESAARVYGKLTLAILLSGSNTDGAAGLRAVYQAGGEIIVQSPETAAYHTMPRSALAANPNAMSLTPAGIINFLSKSEFISNISCI